MDWKIEDKGKNLTVAENYAVANSQAPVVQTMDSAVHRINHYPADKH